jgi:hypothetical protein
MKPRGQQEGAFGLTRKIDEMKERGLCRRRAGKIFYDQRPFRQEGGQPRDAQIFGAAALSSRHAAPDFAQMGLPRSRRSDQYQCGVEPIRPTIDHRHRMLAGSGNEKIFASMRSPVGQLESKLLRSAPALCHLLRRRAATETPEPR